MSRSSLNSLPTWHSPSLWEKHFSKQYQVPYYYHTETGVLVWTAEEASGVYDQEPLASQAEVRAQPQQPPERQAQQDGPRPAENPSTRLQAVGVRADDRIYQLTFYYSDGTGDVLGAVGGAWQPPFMLMRDECLTSVTSWAGDCLHSIQFETSSGRKSPKYGRKFRGHTPRTFEASPGSQIWSLVRHKSFCGPVEGTVVRLRVKALESHRRLQAVTVQSGSFIGRVEFSYSDGAEEVLGGASGHEGGALYPSFMLMHNEFLVKVTGWEGDHLEAIQFVTNTGRKSALFLGKLRKSFKRKHFTFTASPSSQIWGLVRCKDTGKILESREHLVDFESTPTSGDRRGSGALALQDGASPPQPGEQGKKVTSLTRLSALANDSLAMKAALARVEYELSSGSVDGAAEQQTLERRIELLNGVLRVAAQEASVLQKREASLERRCAEESKAAQAAMAATTTFQEELHTAAREADAMQAAAGSGDRLAQEHLAPDGSLQGAAARSGALGSGGAAQGPDEACTEAQLRAEIRALKEEISAARDHRAERHAERRSEFRCDGDIGLLEEQLAEAVANRNELQEEHEQLSLMLTQTEQDIFDKQFDMIHLQNRLRDEPSQLVESARRRCAEAIQHLERLDFSQGVEADLVAAEIAIAAAHMNQSHRHVCA